MNRVRFGLTGLAFVFLLVLGAAALFGPGPVQPEAGGAQTETLATLGVAPGSEPAREGAGQAQPRQPAPAPAAPASPPPGVIDPDPLDAIPAPPPEQRETLPAEGELTEI